MLIARTHAVWLSTWVRYERSYILLQYFGTEIFRSWSGYFYMLHRLFQGIWQGASYSTDSMSRKNRRWWKRYPHYCQSVLAPQGCHPYTKRTFTIYWNQARSETRLCPVPLLVQYIQSGPKVGLHCVTVSKKGFQWLTINTAATILIYLVICENISLCPALTK